MTATTPKLDPITSEAPHGGLLTDRYTLPMAQSFWLHDQHTEPTSFEMFVRSLPRDRGYLIACGIEPALDFLEHWGFSDRELAYLEGQGLYRPAFLDYLSGLTFTGQVAALAEGTPVFAQEPILRVSASRIQADLIESALLAMINPQTMIATKAARIVHAAEPRPVFDFSFRRTWLEAGATISRCSAIGGCAGTSLEQAGLIHGLHTVGTQAHHLNMRFGEDGEETAFRQWLLDYKDQPVFRTVLIDTYDTLRGAARVIAISNEAGVPLTALRLDSGDLAAISQQVRRMLDEAGMTETQVIATNDLDEYEIERLLASGAPIDAFGCGTRLGVSADAPYLGGVYKLTSQEIAGEEIHVIKLAPGKQTDPGRHQIFRRDDHDLLAMEGEQHSGRPLLSIRMQDGQRLATVTLEEARENVRHGLEQLPEAVKALRAPAPWPVRRTQQLWRERAMLGDLEAVNHVLVAS